MIDEQALRRPDFADGVPIVLGDGQSWTFRKPSLRFTPRPAADGTLEFRLAAAYVGVEDPEYERLFDAVLAAEPGVEYAVKLLNLAARLLALNYAVGPAEFAALLPRIPGDEANVAMWDAIAEVALGTPPKPTASGSAAS